MFIKKENVDQLEVMWLLKLDKIQNNERNSEIHVNILCLY